MTYKSCVSTVLSFYFRAKGTVTWEFDGVWVGTLVTCSAGALSRIFTQDCELLSARHIRQNDIRWQVSQLLRTQRTDVAKKGDPHQKITQALARRKPAIMIQTISDMQQWTGDVGRQAAQFAVNRHMKAYGRSDGEQNDSPEGGRQKKEIWMYGRCITSSHSKKREI